MVFFIPWWVVAEESGAAHYGFGGAMLLDLPGPALRLLTDVADFHFRGPRIIATDRQAHRICPQMIRLCSRFDSVLFTPKMSEGPSYGNYSRSPQSSRGQTVAVDAYLREIAKTMSASLIGTMSGIEIEVKAEPLEIDPDRAVPFGLLVNELATNAIKHAFPHGTGHVKLSVEKVGDQIELIVADDGVGMKERDAAKIPEKRGSDYVAIFVRQLGGTIAPLESAGKGTTVRIRLPLLLVPPGGAERVA